MSTEIYNQIKTALAGRDLEDKLVPVGSMHLSIKAPNNYWMEVNGKDMFLANVSASQYLEHLGFRPTSIFDKGARIAPRELLALVKKFADASHDKKLLLRMEHKDQGTAIRAVGSERFIGLDDHNLLKAVEDVLEPYRWEPAWCWRSPTVSYYTYIFPEMTVAPQEGDFLYGGMRIVNSETGHHSLAIRGYLYRIVCTNGAVAPVDIVERFRQYHVGASKEDLLDTATQQIQAIVDQMETLFGLVKRSVEIEIPDPQKEFEALKMKHRLSGKLLGKVIDAYQRESGKTLYHIANAFTWVSANDKEISNAQKVILEELGGELLAAPAAITA